MAEYLIQDSTLEDIADAIRAKTGGSSAMTPSQMAAAVRSISGGKETLSWHQCPEAVRQYLAAALAAYPSDENVTVINQYAPSRGNEVVSNTKPVGYTIDGVTFCDNEPLVATPFATENKAGTLTALDRLRWYNTTCAPAFPKPADRPNKPSYVRGYNARDLGGWACDGGTVRYGLLVRGGEPNPADKALMVDRIGIKTEVQLLPMSEQDEGYVKNSAWGIDWAGNDTEDTSIYGVNDSKALWKKILTDIMDSVLHSKPVYFHCGIGADRTGVVAMCLEAILGVSRADADMDFELTNFAFGWQSLSGGIYRSRVYSTYKSLMAAVNAVPLANGLTDSFRNRWVSFVLSCGISIDKINAFRVACIDGTPDTITVIVPTYTISKSGSHVTYDNDTATVSENSPYSVGVTPSSGYVISDVSVTMGGADITSQAFSGTPTVRRVSVTNNLTHCSTSNSAKLAEAGAAYTATITAASGYTLDGATVSIMMGNTDITASSYSNGAVRITSVTDNISITINAVVEQAPIRYYNIVNNLSNCSTNNASASVSDGSSYSATITAASGYTLDGASVSITMGGIDVSNYYSNGTISIPSVTGDVVISVTAVESVRQNLFDSANAMYNKRPGYSDGGSRDLNGGLITNMIDITSLGTITVEGITESAIWDNNYAVACYYAGSTFGQDYVGYTSYKNATYIFDVAAYKEAHLTATHIALWFGISPSAISAADVANLAIYGS